MTVSLTWNSQTMPLPRKEGGIQIEDAPLVAARRMLSGTLRTDVIAVKARIALRWALLTASQRNTLKAQYDAGGSATLVLPDGQTFTVVAIAHSWREEVLYGVSGQPYYNISIDFEEL